MARWAHWADADDQAKKLVSQTPPVYPEQARKAGFTGVVRLAVVIGEDGAVRDLRVTSSPGFGLETAAMQAVRTWRYQPTVIEGKPVAVLTTVKVAFGQ